MVFMLIIYVSLPRSLTLINIMSMKTSYRYSIVEFCISEFEHPYLGRDAEYGLLLKMKDGSSMELVLMHPFDAFTFRQIPDWMSYLSYIRTYWLAKHYYLNTDRVSRSDNVYHVLLNMVIRFGHRHEKIEL